LLGTLFLMLISAQKKDEKITKLVHQFGAEFHFLYI
jgi:hypothetical protein